MVVVRIADVMSCSAFNVPETARWVTCNYLETRNVLNYVKVLSTYIVKIAEPMKE